MTKLKVGAGRAPIRFPGTLFPYEGFRGVHDEPQVKILLLECGERFVLVSAELVNLFEESLAAMKKIVAQSCGVSPENIWIHVTHAITTPHTPKTRDEFPPHKDPPPHLLDETGEKKAAWNEAVSAAFAEAAAKASKMENARLGYAQGSCDVNTNRDVETPFGWWININPDGPSDKKLHLVRFERADGSPIALLVNYALKPCAIDNSQMREGQRLVSADVPGLGCRIAEEKLGAPCLYLMSAAGDQVPKDQALLEVVDGEGKVRKDDRGVAYGLQLVEQYGKNLGEAILSAAEQAVCAETEDELRRGGCAFSWGVRGRVPVSPGKTASYVAEREAEVTADLLLLSDLALVAAKPEINVLTMQQLQERSPFAHTLLITMVNGGMRYMPDAESYERCTWEAKSASLMPGAAEKWVEETIQALRKLRGDEQI